MAVTSKLTGKRRIMVLFAAAVLSHFGLIGRLAWIQVVKGPELGLKAIQVRTHEVPVESRRGTIYDAKGRELAIGVSADSVFAVPAEVEDPRAAAAALAGVLDLSEDELLRKLTVPAAFVWIQRKVDRDTAERIRSLKLSGIDLTPEGQRYYPKANLLSHVLGISGIDSQGLEGVELEYDHELRGTPGKIVVEYDAMGRELPQALHRYEPAVDGNNVFLTVDEVVQFIAERELDAAIELHQAKGGVVIVMDPRDGAILAMACRPDFDPNRYQDYPASSRRNIAITDTMCPGSTFKPITGAAALEEGVASLSSRFYCGGTLKVPGHVVNCWQGGGHGSQDFTEILKNSCNVAFANLGLALGTERFYKYLDSFGITSITGVDLPGEAVGLVPEKDLCKPVDIAVMSFGQTLTVTPLQLAAAVSAIANGGVMMRPHIVKEIRAADGTLLRRFGPERVREVVSPQTAAELRKAMLAVVEGGTGRQAYIEGYQVAGKTGTAQKVVGGRVSQEKHMASFIGFAPAEDPRILALVILDEPQGGYYGGQIAAPCFKAVMSDVLQYLDFPKSEAQSPGDRRAQGATPEDPGEVQVPNVTGLTAPEAEKALLAAGLRVRVEGKGERVIQQVPPDTATVSRDTTVILFMEEDPSAVVVPYLKGATVREAAAALSALGLRLVPSGSGFATRQVPEAGQQVESGSEVEVRFEPYGEGE